MEKVFIMLKNNAKTLGISNPHQDAFVPTVLNEIIF
jgi:hypothetical protein